MRECHRVTAQPVTPALAHDARHHAPRVRSPWRSVRGRLGRRVTGAAPGGDALPPPSGRRDAAPGLRSPTRRNSRWIRQLPEAGDSQAGRRAHRRAAGAVGRCEPGRVRRLRGAAARPHPLGPSQDPESRRPHRPGSAARRLPGACSSRALEDRTRSSAPPGGKAPLVDQAHVRRQTATSRARGQPSYDRDSCLRGVGNAAGARSSRALPSPHQTVSDVRVAKKRLRQAGSASS